MSMKKLCCHFYCVHVWDISLSHVSNFAQCSQDKILRAFGFSLLYKKKQEKIDQAASLFSLVYAMEQCPIACAQKVVQWCPSFSLNIKPIEYFTIQLKFTKCWNNWAEFLMVNNFNNFNYIKSIFILVLLLNRMIISQSNSNSQNAEITEQNFWRLTTSTA